MAKLTEAQIKEETKKIQELIEKIKRENKAEHLTVLTPEQIDKKLQRVNSPMIIGQSWNPTNPGGTVSYTLNLFNPETRAYGNLYAHVWVGTGNVDPVVGTFLQNVDTRFPRLTQPQVAGLTMAGGSNAQLIFNLQVPANVQLTNYLGNSCLMGVDYHDVGQYFDRGCFVFRVS